MPTGLSFEPKNKSFWRGGTFSALVFPFSLCGIPSTFTVVGRRSAVYEYPGKVQEPMHFRARCTFIESVGVITFNLIQQTI